MPQSCTGTLWKPLDMRTACLLLMTLVALSRPALAVDIDGHIDPGEWKGARHITDFRQTQPLTGKPATLKTEAWILATPKGLAVAFRNVQPPDVPRTSQRLQRDFEDQVDRVNLVVDFNGDGRTGYNFTVSPTGDVYDAVITNENSFNKDWDGIWKHAVSQDASSWTVEMLIPWYTAPMHKAIDGKRRLGIYLDRVIGSTGERDGALFLPPSFEFDFQHKSPRHGDWLFTLDVTATSGGLAGNRKVGYTVKYQPTYFVSDDFNVYTGLTVDRTPAWLIWQHDNLVGEFSERALQMDAGFDWSIGDRSELRMKLQALGLDARIRQGYVVAANGRALAGTQPVSDFNLRNMGLQIRYRYRLAPLSYLYLVYGRGGYAQDACARDTIALLRSSFALRNDEQFLVKVSYRFDM